MIASASGRRRKWLRVLCAALLRGGLLALVWVVLAGWDGDYALYGVVSVAAATGLSMAMFPVRGGGSPSTASLWRRSAAIATLPLWFIWKSVVGGVDVAWRALRRPVDVDPAVITAPCRLPDGNALQVALLMMNLMPGTMVQRVIGDGDTVELHTLSSELDPVKQWEALQDRIERALGR